MEKTKELLSLEDAIWVIDFLDECFGSSGRIDDYLRESKISKMKELPRGLPGYSIGDNFFNSDIHPNDIEIEFSFPDSGIFHKHTSVVSSHILEKSIPGKVVRIFVHEKSTKRIIGMIRLGSPVINIKPRNEYLGLVLDSLNHEMMSRFNKSAIMGFTIVPVQPFGYNYLGGKLLSLVCTSHEIREYLNTKYGMNLCLFETTSLYGSTKSASQYDGMKPYLRYVGLTDSKFIPMIPDGKYKVLNDFFTVRFGNELVPKEASSRKLKLQSKFLAITKNSLKDCVELERFKEVLDKALALQEQKRYYVSDYGYKNTKDYVVGKTDQLIKNPENWDKFYLENQLKWWKSKAAKRYEKLKLENRFRTKLELWNENTDMDIIR